MKYIRTTDGRIIDLEQGWSVVDLYDGTKQLKRSFERSVYQQNGDYGTIFQEHFTDFDILKEADTIEELCDEFVVISNKRKIVNKRGSKRVLLFGTGEKMLKIYGAIWTEWGLKYVAKMNDKGELELL